jgi:hypothetical protein
MNARLARQGVAASAIGVRAPGAFNNRDDDGRESWKVDINCFNQGSLIKLELKEHQET